MSQKPASTSEYQLKHEHYLDNLSCYYLYNLQNKDHIELSDDEFVCKESVHSGERHLLWLWL